MRRWYAIEICLEVERKIETWLELCCVIPIYLEFGAETESKFDLDFVVSANLKLYFSLNSNSVVNGASWRLIGGANSSSNSTSNVNDRRINFRLKFELKLGLKTDKVQINVLTFEPNPFRT